MSINEGMVSTNLEGPSQKSVLSKIVAGWRTMFPGMPIYRIAPDTLEIGVAGEGSVTVQDMMVAAGMPRLMVLTKLPLDARNSKHEMHWYRVAQILNTDIRGVTFIYSNVDPVMGQPVLTMRSSMPLGHESQSIDMIALYCEVIAVFEARRIMQEVLSVSLQRGVLRADMYDKTEGVAKSQFRIIHPGVDSVQPQNVMAAWEELCENIHRRGEVDGVKKGARSLEVTVEGSRGQIEYHEETHTLTLEMMLPPRLTQALLAQRNSFEIAELLNILHLLHPMGCFEYDSDSGHFKYGSLFRLVTGPTMADVELLAQEIAAVQVVLQEVLNYQEEMEGQSSAA